jgi:hypothetical protein
VRGHQRLFSARTQTGADAPDSRRSSHASTCDGMRASRGRRVSARKKETDRKVMKVRTIVIVAALGLVAVSSLCHAQAGDSGLPPWKRMSSSPPPAAPILDDSKLPPWRRKNPPAPPATPCTEMRPVFVPAIREHGFYQPARTEYDGFAAQNCDAAKRQGWKCTCAEFKLLAGC